MALFVVLHRHEADRCPARDPDAGAMLLNVLSRPSARRHGVEIRAEAVVNREHALYLIVEAEGEDRLQEFLRPFARAGRVEIYPAPTCARVVASGGCSAPLGDIDDSARAVDPEQACQQAIEAGLVVHRAHPLNCEAPLPSLVGGAVVPNAQFFVRNHFQIPVLDPSAWQLGVDGLVERPLLLSLRDLMNMPSQTLCVTLECAGNGRALFDPPVEGEKWGLGAVSAAEWTGVPLRELFDRAGIKARAREIVFRGADSGTLPERKGRVRFERSLELAHAQGSEALLAYAMNGEPLPIQHGYPLRLVVPGWYGMASVKWLTEIEITGESLAGPFQTDAYFYESQRDGATVREPVSLQRVRSVILEPRPDEAVERGDLAIRGVAWSGAAPIARVEVKVGGGEWNDARLVGAQAGHGWQWWEWITRVEAERTTIRARATDLTGRTQPERAEWNRLGYGNNAIQEVALRIR